MNTFMLSEGVRTANGKYIIDGWKYSECGKTWGMVRNVGWCQWSEKLNAVLVPNVGWMTY